MESPNSTAIFFSGMLFFNRHKQNAAAKLAQTS